MVWLTAEYREPGSEPGSESGPGSGSGSGPGCKAGPRNLPEDRRSVDPGSCHLDPDPGLDPDPDPDPDGGLQWQEEEGRGRRGGMRHHMQAARKPGVGGAAGPAPAAGTAGAPGGAEAVAREAPGGEEAVSVAGGGAPCSGGGGSRVSEHEVWLDSFKNLELSPSSETNITARSFRRVAPSRVCFQLAVRGEPGDGGGDDPRMPGVGGTGGAGDARGAGGGAGDARGAGGGMGVVGGGPLAVYVVLAIRLQGRFSDNVFVLDPCHPRGVCFQGATGAGDVGVEQVQQSLEIRFLNEMQEEG